MRVVFRVNLALPDAKAMKLDAKECRAGMTCDVDDKAAAVLLGRGIAVKEADAGKDELIKSLREEQKAQADKIQAVAKDSKLTGPAK